MRIGTLADCLLIIKRGWLILILVNISMQSNLLLGNILKAWVYPLFLAFRMSP